MIETASHPLPVNDAIPHGNGVCEIDSQQDPECVERMVERMGVQVRDLIVR